MKNYIENPISQKDWDPTKGDFFNEKVMQEDQLYFKRKKRKKILIAFLAAIHLLFVFIIIFLF